MSAIDRALVFSEVRKNGPAAAIDLCRKLGYRRVNMGSRGSLAAICTADRADWIELPAFTINQADATLAAYSRLPHIGD